jgi:hypothetical protein
MILPDIVVVLVVIVLGIMGAAKKKSNIKENAVKK